MQDQPEEEGLDTLDGDERGWTVGHTHAVGCTAGGRPRGFTYKCIPLTLFASSQWRLQEKTGGTDPWH